jgi:cell fate (sporulation/competence/biofilm development) regulator YlbF (YheA/YmcA/DUF963 family)
MSEIERNSNEGKLTKDEAKGLVEMFKYILKAYGQFAETLGNIQQTHKEAFASMFSLESAIRLPEVLSELSEKQPELGKLLTEMLIKLTTLLPRLSNLMSLSAKEKVELGEHLKYLAKDFDKIREWIDKPNGE